MLFSPRFVGTKLYGILVPKECVPTQRQRDRKEDSNES